MLLAQGQSVLARYAGEEFPAVVDRYWPGSAYQQIKPTDGRWITPCVVHVDDLRLVDAQSSLSPAPRTTGAAPI